MQTSGVQFWGRDTGWRLRICGVLQCLKLGRFTANVRKLEHGFRMIGARLGSLIVYLQDMRVIMFQLFGYYYKGFSGSGFRAQPKYLCRTKVGFLYEELLLTLGEVSPITVPRTLRMRT